MKIVLVRHGQTPANRLGALDTVRPGLGLTEEGLAQARHIAAGFVLDIGQEQIFFVCKVVIDGSAPHVGVSGDVGKRDFVERFSGQELTQ